MNNETLISIFLYFILNKASFLAEETLEKSRKIQKMLTFNNLSTVNVPLDVPFPLVIPFLTQIPATEIVESPRYYSQRIGTYQS